MLETTNLSLLQKVIQTESEFHVSVPNVLFRMQCFTVRYSYKNKKGTFHIFSKEL